MNYLIIFILTLISQNVFAQHFIMPASSRYSINYSKHKGYIILKNGERINGTFEYAADEFPTYNLKYYLPDGKLKQRIKASNIERAVMVGSDTSLLINDSTVFIHLKSNGPYLYRQLTYGAIKIYDRLFNVNEKPGLIYPELFVIINGKTYKTKAVAELIDLLNKNGFSFHKSKRSTLEQIIREMNSTN